MPRETVLAIDLEGTLISNAVSQFPRPGLYAFLEFCRARFERLYQQHGRVSRAIFHCEGEIAMIVKSVLFDVFGTLLDDEVDVYLSPYSQLLQPLQLDSQEKSRAVRLIYTMPWPTLEAAADELEQVFPGRRIPTANRRRAAADLEQQMQSMRLVDGVSEWLPRLKAAGLKLALVSNLTAPYRRVILEHGLDQLVDSMVFSFEVGFQKPDPQVFQIALDRTDATAAETVMIGDDEENDCDAARTLGIKSRLVEPGGQDGGASLRHVLRWVLSRTNAPGVNQS